jgi:hypothetical protein
LDHRCLCANLWYHQHRLGNTPPHYVLHACYVASLGLPCDNMQCWQSASEIHGAQGLSHKPFRTSEVYFDKPRLVGGCGCPLPIDTGAIVCILLITWPHQLASRFLHTRQTCTSHYTFGLSNGRPPCGPSAFGYVVVSATPPLFPACGLRQLASLLRRCQELRLGHDGFLQLFLAAQP